jgi:predicted DNA-binding protein
MTIYIIKADETGDGSMPLVLTQVYLDADQKKALTAQAKKTGRNASELVREAVDALLLGVSTDELKQLDAATQQAESDLKAMIKVLDTNAKQHRSFMAEMTRLRGES